MVGMKKALEEREFELAKKILEKKPSISVLKKPPKRKLKEEIRKEDEETE
jgi:hypothetical protein